MNLVIMIVFGGASLVLSLEAAKRLGLVYTRKQWLIWMPLEWVILYLGWYGIDLAFGRGTLLDGGVSGVWTGVTMFGQMCLLDWWNRR